MTDPLTQVAADYGDARRAAAFLRHYAANDPAGMTAVPPPRKRTFVDCLDCLSRTGTFWYGAVMQVEVTHDPTCPAWTAPGREVALAFLPRSSVEDEPPTMTVRQW